MKLDSERLVSRRLQAQRDEANDNERRLRSQLDQSESRLTDMQREVTRRPTHGGAAAAASPPLAPTLPATYTALSGAAQVAALRQIISQQLSTTLPWSLDDELAGSPQLNGALERARNVGRSISECGKGDALDGGSVGGAAPSEPSTPTCGYVLSPVLKAAEGGNGELPALTAREQVLKARRELVALQSQNEQLSEQLNTLPREAFVEGKNKPGKESELRT